MPQNPTRARRLRSLTATLAGFSLLGGSLMGLPAAAAPAGGQENSTGSTQAPTPQEAPEDAPRQTPEETPEPAPQNYEDGRYYVILEQDPAVTYTGGEEGLAPTAVPQDGEFQPESTAVQEYEQYLAEEQSEVAASEDVEVETHFTTAVNAFVSELTAEQALELARDPRVLGVTEDYQASPDYSSTEFLGLPGPQGAWSTVYGSAEEAGEGVVVGVIDTGIFPDQAFIEGDPVQPLEGDSAQVGEPYRTADGRTAMLKADGSTFRGSCQTGPDFPAASCNDKLMGAYYYSEDFERFVPPAQRDPRERLSPLDVSSHGTHVGTTAVGNNGVDQVMDGGDFGTGSGVAPAAKLASYKICWEDTDPTTGGCYSTASVAAIEQAIIDNVDVINYSVSGNNTSIIDPVALAFKSAAEAGIFVATSAGNNGPAPNTVNHSSPWVTSVAATTFSNELTGTVEFTEGPRIRGVSAMTEGVGPAEIVLASEVGAAGRSPEQVRLCQPGALDPAQVEGKIVVCDRGVNPRVEKSEVVAQAGGVGMVLVNIGGGSEDADLHAVPTVHTSDESIKQFVATTDVQASLVQGDTTSDPQPPVPQIAGFSSRGPSNAVNSALLKPDVSAPGVNVIAGVSPLDPMYNGNTFGLMSGTSMAAPNLAGMAALLSSEHPGWSPMALKSAMMTSTENVLNADGSVNTDNFATGAGSAEPAAMAAPGLVYDADTRQWDAMLLGQLAPGEINSASIAAGDVIDSATVTRTVTATQPGTWAATAQVPGFSVSASPATVSLDAGESAEVSLTFTRTSAPSNAWVHGSFSWVRPGGADVTSPVTLRAQDAQAPESVTGAGPSGSVDVELTGGTDTTLQPEVAGLARTDAAEVTLEPGPASLEEDESNYTRVITVPEGAQTLTVSATAQEPTDDWDLRLVLPDGTIEQTQGVGGAPSPTVTIENPAPGEYEILANLFATVDGDEATATVESVVLAGDAGNLTVSPDPLTVSQGETTEATLSWSGLTEGTWRGTVAWASGVSTQVAVTVGGAGPGEPPVCDQPDFTDNPPGSPFYEPIRWMQCTGITQGYADGSYGVRQQISRGESVTFLYRYLDPAFSPPQTSPFPDVPWTSAHFTPIAWAAENEITRGYSDGTFRPSQQVTRGEFATFLFRAVEPDYTAPDTSPFPDVPTTNSHYRAIAWAHENGLVSGYQDGTFRPTRSITRGETAVVLYRYDTGVAEQ